MNFGADHQTILFKALIGKKNNQSRGLQFLGLHRRPMETKKLQPSGQWIMPETRYTSFSALSVYPRVGISLSKSETDDRFFLSCTWTETQMRL